MMTTLADSQSLIVIGLVAKLHGLGMTVLSSVTVDICLTVNLSVVLCAKITDEVTDTRVSDSPVQ